MKIESDLHKVRAHTKGGRCAFVGRLATTKKMSAVDLHDECNEEDTPTTCRPQLFNAPLAEPSSH